MNQQEIVKSLADLYEHQKSISAWTDINGFLYLGRYTQIAQIAHKLVYPEMYVKYTKGTKNP